MQNRILPQRKALDHSIHSAARFGGCFFLTLCVQPRGVDQLCQPEVSKIILETVRRYDDGGRWWCGLFLLMPDHCHALISVAAEVSLAKTIQDFKRATARLAGVKWQRGFFDHRLRNDESSSEKYDYILANPWRAGLVAEGEVWPHVFVGGGGR